MIAAAWAAYAGSQKWPLKLSTPQAPRNGWEERRTYQYETSPNEKKTVFAAAYRAGKAWVVTDHRRSGCNVREAGRADLPRSEQPATEGLREGVVRREEGASRRHEDGHGGEGVPRGRDEAVRRAGSRASASSTAARSSSRVASASGSSASRRSSTRTRSSSRPRTRRRSRRCSSPSWWTRRSCVGTSPSPRSTRRSGSATRRRRSRCS